VVLDTQVCLDLWLFGDVHASLLRDALASGALLAVRDAATRGEWCRVLRYRALALDEATCVQLEGEYDARLQSWTTAGSAPRPDPPLPRCTDPDDQKFLELAYASGAAALFTRDAALLRLARRVAAQGRFAILSPAAFGRESPATPPL
jgi:predicted nucleic acid-binding protein